MTVRKRRDTGRWQARYLGPDGRERAKDFNTKREAQTWKDEQSRRVRRLEWTDPDSAKVSLGELWPKWLASRSIKPKTRADYESLWTTCVQPTWGDMRIDRVTPSAVQTWVSNMNGQNGLLLSASRRRQAHGLLAKVLDLAVVDGRIPKNPARAGNSAGRGGYLPRIPKNQRRRYLTHAEVERLALASGHQGDLIRTLAYCGLRWGEAAALRVSDVDLMRGRIHVERSVSEVHGHLIYGTTKTHQSREVPMPGFLRDRIASLTAEKQSGDFVFAAKRGEALRLPNFTRRVFHPALEAAGLERMKLHDLRHTAAGLAVDSGANVKGVQRMLGHADAAMTLNTYADLFDGHLDAVADRLDEARSEALTDSARTGHGRVLPMRELKSS